MSRYIDLSVTVDETTLSPPSTNLRLEVTPHRRGPGFWQVSSVRQSLHTGAHIDSPLHVFKDGITTAEISLDQVMGEALVVDLPVEPPAPPAPPVVEPEVVALSSPPHASTGKSVAPASQYKTRRRSNMAAMIFKSWARPWSWTCPTSDPTRR